jgi:hypothetical protein
MLRIRCPLLAISTATVAGASAPTCIWSMRCTSQVEQGWVFHGGDAGAVLNDETPVWLIRLALGPHDGRLQHSM